MSALGIFLFFALGWGMFSAGLLEAASAGPLLDTLNISSRAGRTPKSSRQAYQTNFGLGTIVYNSQTKTC